MPQRSLDHKTITIHLGRSMELLDRGVHLKLNPRQMPVAAEWLAAKWTETTLALNNKCKIKISNKNQDTLKENFTVKDVWICWMYRANVWTAQPKTREILIYKEEIRSLDTTMDSNNTWWQQMAFKEIINKLDSMQTKWITTTTNKDKINITLITNNKGSSHKLKRRMTNSLKGKATTTNVAGAKSTRFTLKMINIARTTSAQATWKTDIPKQKEQILNQHLPTRLQKPQPICDQMQQIIIEWKNSALCATKLLIAPRWMVSAKYVIKSQGHCRALPAPTSAKLRMWQPNHRVLK